MKSIILAAGRGSRINILTSKQPKCLIKVAGKTLLSWQIKALNNQSSKICIVTGYLSNLIEKDIKNIQKISTVKNILWKKTNMIFSLFCAKKWIDNYDLTCFIEFGQNRDLVNYRLKFNAITKTFRRLRFP